MISVTESHSHYDDLEQCSTEKLLTGINQEDLTVAGRITPLIPKITPLVDAIVERMQAGGRLFYVGAGTSGRLGVLDAAECPPTFGSAPDLVQGIIAGGEKALSRAVEFAEDNRELAIQEMQALQLSTSDTVIGISASGTAPYVLAAIEVAQQQRALTASITCNPESTLSNAVPFPIICVVGPEFVTGSTRMKAGTATKLILNMISTTVMIKLGHVYGNQMVDLQQNNHKLQDRAVRIVMSTLDVSREVAMQLLAQHGSIRAACVQVIDKK